MSFPFAIRQFYATYVKDYGDLRRRVMYRNPIRHFLALKKMYRGVAQKFLSRQDAKVRKYHYDRLRRF